MIIPLWHLPVLEVIFPRASSTDLSGIVCANWDVLSRSLLLQDLLGDRTYSLSCRFSLCHFCEDHFRCKQQVSRLLSAHPLSLVAPSYPVPQLFSL